MSAFRTVIAAAALFSLPLMSVSALAASPYQTSAEQPTKPAPAAPGTKAKAAAESARPAPRPGVPAPKALPPDIAGECAWTGKRVISLLARDDVEQAARFQAFYRDFGCRESHLGPTFRCVIMGDGVPAEGDATAQGEDTFTTRVDRCWSRN